MRKSLTVNIPGIDFGLFNVGFIEIQRGAVIIHGRYAVQPACSGLIQYKNLSLGFPLAAFDHGFAVQLEIVRSFLHKAVDFGCGHIVFIGQADKNRLSAAFLSQKDPARSQIGVHGYGMRTFKIIDRQAEGLFDGMTLRYVFFDLKRNNFRVGGYVFGDHHSAVFQFLFELLKIVDITVQTGVNNRTVIIGLIRRFVIHRVTVGFCNCANRRPAGVRRHRVKYGICPDEPLKNVIPGNLPA